MAGVYYLDFTKAVASGNDFVIIDPDPGIPDDGEMDYPGIARSVSQRRISAGADGLLVIGPSKEADVRMRIFNPDGTEADMCGNGARCAALYASARGLGDIIRIETAAGIIDARVKNGNVKIRMNDPKDIRLGINLGVGTAIMQVHHINTGVPHVVHIVNDIENFDVIGHGRKIRSHTMFAPEGANADFVGDIGGDRASVRTYERGVEDETPACGTGSVASALILGLLGQVSSPVKIRTRGGETLTVFFNMVLGRMPRDVYLEGEAKLVFDGKIRVRT